MVMPSVSKVQTVAIVPSFTVARYAFAWSGKLKTIEKCSTNCIFIILFIIHNVFLHSKKFCIPKGLYRYKNSHFEGFGVFECSIIKLLLNTAITLWPLFSKIVRNFVVPTQPATWAIQLNLCLKAQPLELFGPVQTTGYL